MMSMKDRNNATDCNLWSFVSASRHDTGQLGLPCFVIVSCSFQLRLELLPGYYALNIDSDTMHDLLRVRQKLFTMPYYSVQRLCDRVLCVTGLRPIIIVLTGLFASDAVSDGFIRQFYDAKRVATIVSD